MNDLSLRERAVFLAIYDADHGDAPTAGPAIESLIRRGLLSSDAEGRIAPTDAGEDLYIQLQGDEPYEGI
jgi:hypothetical protein